jgi:hypothetical protein
MRWVRRVSGIVWIFSWYTIYREIFRWHHMTKTLRFNPPPPLPGTDIQPRPGAPLLAVCLGSVAAPLVFLTATMMERMRVRPGSTSAQTTNQQELTRFTQRPHLPQGGSLRSIPAMVAGSRCGGPGWLRCWRHVHVECEGFGVGVEVPGIAFQGEGDDG